MAKRKEALEAIVRLAGVLQKLGGKNAIAAKAILAPRQRRLSGDKEVTRERRAGDPKAYVELTRRQDEARPRLEPLCDHVALVITGATKVLELRARCSECGELAIA